MIEIYMRKTDDDKVKELITYQPNFEADTFVQAINPSKENKKEAMDGLPTGQDINTQEYSVLQAIFAQKINPGKVQEMAEKEDLSTVQVINKGDYSVLQAELDRQDPNFFRVCGALTKTFHSVIFTSEIPSPTAIVELRRELMTNLFIAEPIGYSETLSFPEISNTQEVLRNPELMDDPDLIFWFEILTIHWCICQWLFPNKEKYTKRFPSTKELYTGNRIFIKDDSGNNLGLSATNGIGLR
jgi:hypothetical protein